MHEGRTTSVLIVGVGGQGIVVAGEILASVCLAGGKDVKQSEVHGMAQRGGSVTSHVRFGEVVYSPTVERGCADVLLSFELLEGLRWIEYLRPEGVAIVNGHRIAPMTVLTGAAEYPIDVRDQIVARCGRVLWIDGEAAARDLGDLRIVNVLLLGALSVQLPFGKDLWEAAIRRRVPEHTVDMNLTGFEAGIRAALDGGAT